MERENFEESWRDAFEGAEVTPSEKVWTNIELELEKEKGDTLKKRLLFFQMLAAASVIFAMAIGGAAVYHNLDRPSPDQLAAETGEHTERAVSPYSDAPSLQAPRPATAGQDDLPGAEALAGAGVDSGQPDGRQLATREKDEPHPRKTAGSPDAASGEEAGVNGKAIDRNPTASERTTRSRSNERPMRSGPLDAALAGNAPAAGVGPHDALPRQLDERALPALYTHQPVHLTFPSQRESVDPVVAMLARLEQRAREVQADEDDRDEKEQTDENLWTSIGFAAGSFNSMQSSGAASSGAAMTLAAPIVDQETKASGYSYSMGVNIGTKLSDRWVLQGGVNYLTHASEYTANNMVMSTTSYQQQRFRAASTNELVKADADDLSSKIVYSAPYNVNNSMRYLSVPLQAGYLLVNKTFGLQLNAGVATDLFLQNTISADSDQLDKTSQPGGADSPYRSVNFSGLFGTEVSYRFGEHYRISLNPGLRYPLNTIYKSELGVNATPLTFDVGLRFRYIFR